MDYNLERSKIPAYTNEELINLNEELITSIRSRSGKGFVNSDLGHPSYRLGAKGEINYKMWGDDPEHNSLYKLLKSLHEEMSKRGLPIDIKIESWQEFCTFTINVYEAYLDT